MFDRIPHIYYYVPPCPACGSRKTGRYVRQPLTAGDMRFVEVESLRSGELIRFAPRIPEKNVYCEDCGHEWACSIRASLMPRERIMEEQTARGSAEKYAACMERSPGKKKSVFGKIFGFLP
jgi:hypothetical protein